MGLPTDVDISARRGPVRSRRRSWARPGGWTIAALLLMSIALLWVCAYQTMPSLEHLSDQVTPNTGDPLFLTWVMAWEGHALVHHPAHLFAGNMFYPRTDAISWSDNMFIAAPVFQALSVISGHRYLVAYNLVVLLGFLGVGLSVFALASKVLKNRMAALVVAFLLDFAPPHTGQLGHAQLLGFMFVPLSLLALIRFIETRAWRHAVFLGGAFAACWLTSAYYLVLDVVVCFAFLVTWLIQNRLRPGERFVRGLALSGAVSLLCVGWSLPPYIRLQQLHLFDRSPAEQFRPPISNLVQVPPSFLYRGIAGASWPGDAERAQLYPGALLLILATLAVVTALYRRRRRAVSPIRVSRPTAAGPSPNAENSTYWWPLAISCLPAIALTIGPSSPHGSSIPFNVMRHVVPGVASVRELSRFWLYPVMILALLAGKGIVRILQFLKPRLRPVATTVLMVLAAVELVFPAPPAPVALTGAPVASNTLLRHLPSGAVLELPPPQGPLAPYIATSRIFYSLIDLHPRVNGYGGAIPPSVAEWYSMAEGLPVTELVPLARSYGIRYLVLHQAPQPCASGYSPPELATITAQLQTTPGVAAVWPESDGLVIQLAPAPLDRNVLRWVGPTPPRPSQCS